MILFECVKLVSNQTNINIQFEITYFWKFFVLQEYPLPGGYYKFSCQNGCAECIANLILNCASYYSTSHVQYINFALCVMASSYPPLEAENVSCSYRLCA